MERRLPSHARHAVHALWRTIETSDHDQQQGLPKTHARRVVADTMTEDAESISEKAIDHRLQFLHDHGEIYYVDNWVRITQPDDVAADCEAGPDD